MGTLASDNTQIEVTSNPQLLTVCLSHGVTDRLARIKKEPTPKNDANGNGANLGFELTLWAAADKMRGHMDAAEYKHVALGLIFLKYISDAFQELYDD